MSQFHEESNDSFRNGVWGRRRITQGYVGKQRRRSISRRSEFVHRCRFRHPISSNISYHILYFKLYFINSVIYLRSIMDSLKATSNDEPVTRKYTTPAVTIIRPSPTSFLLYLILYHTLYFKLYSIKKIVYCIEHYYTRLHARFVGDGLTSPFHYQRRPSTHLPIVDRSTHRSISCSGTI